MFIKLVTSQAFCCGNAKPTNPCLQWMWVWGYFCFVLFVLQFTVQSRLAFNLWSSCLYLPSIGITAMSHHAQLFNDLELISPLKLNIYLIRHLEFKRTWFSFSFQEYPVYFLTLDSIHDTHLLSVSNIPVIVTRGKKFS